MVAGEDRVDLGDIEEEDSTRLYSLYPGDSFLTFDDSSFDVGKTENEENRPDASPRSTTSMGDRTPFFHYLSSELENKINKPWNQSIGRSTRTLSLRRMSSFRKRTRDDKATKVESSEIDAFPGDPGNHAHRRSKSWSTFLERLKLRHSP